MTGDKLNCPKCGQLMEEGFVPDFTYGGVYRPEWIKGQPKKSWWLGIDWKNAHRWKIETFRCTGCGYLASYARQPATERYGRIQ